MKKQNWSVRRSTIRITSAGLLSGLVLLSFAQNAWAHHPFGGTTPDSVVEGFISGLGHPVIGLDHLIFVIASGLLAAGSSQGWAIPVGFVLATLVGTVVHLQSIDLPIPEVVIAASVLLFGVLLILRTFRGIDILFNTYLLAAIAVVAGIFHGYAYGEAIVGAEITPLIAYLTGFASIQLGIAMAAYAVGNVIRNRLTANAFPVIRLAGFAIGAMGLVFLSSSVIG